jgi:hypothetical protein
MNALATYEPPAIVASSSFAPGYHSHPIYAFELGEPSLFPLPLDMRGCVWSCWACGGAWKLGPHRPATWYAFRLDGTWGEVSAGFAGTAHPPQLAPVPVCDACEQVVIDAAELAQLELAAGRGRR